MAISKSLLVLPVAALVGGCATPTTPELASGNAVRQMVAAQTEDPAASDKNGTRTPQGTDPTRANNAIKAMRDGVTKTDGEARGVVLNVGSSGDSGGR